MTCQPGSLICWTFSPVLALIPQVKVSDMERFTTQRAYNDNGEVQIAFSVSTPKLSLLPSSVTSTV